LLTGLLFYFIGLVILVLTGNPNLFPTVVILGSFMVPATYVAFFYDRRHLSNLSLPTTALSFFYGGVLGVFAAALLEPLFIGSLDFGTAFVVGLIEEFVKILGILVIARRLRHDSMLDGLILGAAAGMGFAALESTGYAFTSFLVSGGSLSVTVGVTLLRGLLAPLGHGTWTAILAAVMFRESTAGRFRINRKVIGAYLTVVILHGLWDGLPILIGAFVSSGPDVFIGQSLVAAVGLFILWRRWREARRLQVAQILAAIEANAQPGIVAEPIAPVGVIAEPTAAAEPGRSHHGALAPEFHRHRPLASAQVEVTRRVEIRQTLDLQVGPRCPRGEETCHHVTLAR
jgi:RsiW-degrading membrane proteinase PrsW (M82 family)